MTGKPSVAGEGQVRVADSEIKRHPWCGVEIVLGISLVNIRVHRAGDVGGSLSEGRHLAQQKVGERLFEGRGFASFGDGGIVKREFSQTYSAGSGAAVVLVLQVEAELQGVAADRGSIVQEGLCYGIAFIVSDDFREVRAVDIDTRHLGTS